MWKCEKGKKQYIICKEANADYCSDCPHGVQEDSVEGDIKILDEMILNCKYKHNYYDEYANKKAKVLEKCKKALKENKEYYKQLDLDYTEKNFIPVQKIKDKVDGLKQKAINYGPFIDKDESFSIESKISVLQELLESEE